MLLQFLHNCFPPLFCVPGGGRLQKDILGTRSTVTTTKEEGGETKDGGKEDVSGVNWTSKKREGDEIGSSCSKEKRWKRKCFFQWEKENSLFPRVFVLQQVSLEARSVSAAFGREWKTFSDREYTNSWRLNLMWYRATTAGKKEIPSVFFFFSFVPNSPHPPAALLSLGTKPFRAGEGGERRGGRRIICPWQEEKAAASKSPPPPVCAHTYTEKKFPLYCAKNCEENVLPNSLRISEFVQRILSAISVHLWSITWGDTGLKKPLSESPLRDNVAEFVLPLAAPPAPLFLQGGSGDIRLIPGKMMVS